MSPTRPWFTFEPAHAPIESGSIEYSMDSISSRAQVTFPGNYRGPLFPAVDINQRCHINGGLRTAGGGQSIYSLFDGWIEDDGSDYAGTSLENTLSLGDRLRLTQYAIGDPAFDMERFNYVAYFDATADTAGVPGIYANGPWTDTSVVQHLFTLSGVGDNMSGIGGRDVSMATGQGFTLNNTQPPADLIGQIDDATACKTFATPSGPRRIVTTYTPSTSARWTLREGIEILQISNKRSFKQFYNRVIVKGLVLGAAKIISIRQAPANLPPVAGGANLQLPFGRGGSNPITKVFNSDLIQTQDLADTVSYQLLVIGNRVERRISVTTDFNPLAEPGQTVAIYAPHAKVYSTINGYAWGVRHAWDSGGAWTTWDVAIYDGSSGDIVPPPNIAVFDPQVNGPFVDVDG